MKFRRRKYIVDPKLQFAVLSHVAGVILAVGAIYLAALLLLPEDPEPVPGPEVRDMLIDMNFMYAATAAIVIVALALALTHRIAGPMRVLENALRAIRRGDFSQRTKLRRKDYLHSLADEVQELSSDLQQRHQDLEALEACLAEKDLEGAKEIVTRLKGAPAEAPAAEEAPVPA